MRAACAHIASVYLGSGVLMLSLGFMEAGPIGALDFVARWAGGLLIFAVLSIVSLPLGLVIRYLALKVVNPSLSGAILVGVVVSVALVPLLHPAMIPPVSLWTAPFSLAICHGLAGAFGGWVWWRFEQPDTQNSMPASPAN